MHLQLAQGEAPLLQLLQLSLQHRECQLQTPYFCILVRVPCFVRLGEYENLQVSGRYEENVGSGMLSDVVVQIYAGGRQTYSPQ